MSAPFEKEIFGLNFLGGKGSSIWWIWNTLFLQVMVGRGEGGGMPPVPRDSDVGCEIRLKWLVSNNECILVDLVRK